MECMFSIKMKKMEKSFILGKVVPCCKMETGKYNV